MDNNIFTPVIDFSTYIAEKARNLTGRTWVFQAVKDWLIRTDGSRYFLITGKPGCGKSAIAARLVQFSSGLVFPPDGLAMLGAGLISAVHFCSARDRRWVDPSTFAQSVALQLASRNTGFAKALAERSGDRQIHIEVDQKARYAHNQIGVLIKSIDVSGVSAEDAFDRTVREPLEAMFRENPDEHLVILIDALDEARIYSGKVGIIPLLAEADNLPKGVRFILTSRQDAEIENEFPQAERLFLSAAQFDKANNDDVHNYLQERLSNDEQLSALAAELQPSLLNDVIETATMKSAGNFQYVTLLMDSVARGQRVLSDLDGLPNGLDGLYEDSLNRVVQVGGGQWKSDYAPLIGVLSVARESLTIAQLQAFTGQSETAVWNNLVPLEQFIPRETTKEIQGKQVPRFALYHQSMIDFLRRQSLVVGGREFSNRYYLPAEDQHRCIMDHYRGNNVTWQDVNWKQVDDYGIQHLASHLYALRNVKPYSRELYGLICRTFMQEKRRRFGSHRSFAADVMLAINVARSANSPDLLQEVRNCYLLTALGEFANNSSAELLGAMAWLGQAKRALDFAALIDNRLQYERGDVRWFDEQTSRSVIAVRRIPGPQTKALSVMGSVLFKQGELDTARDVLLQALGLLEEEDDEGKEIGSRILTIPMAQCGLLDHLLQQVDMIDDADQKFKALSGMAQELAEKGEKEKAVKVAHTALGAMQEIENRETNAIVLSRMALCLALTGDSEGAKQKAEEALIVIEHLPDLSDAADTLSAIAETLAKVGITEKVIPVAMDMQSVASSFQDDITQSEFLISLSETLAASGAFDSALKIARSIRNKTSRAAAMYFVAKTLYQKRDFDGANKVAADINDPVYVEYVQRDEVLNLFDVGKLDQALQRAEEYGASEDPLVLSRAALNLAEKGDSATALDLVRQAELAAEYLDDPETREDAAVEIAKAMVNSGQTDKALNIVETIGDANYQVDALVAIAVQLMRSGEKAKAQKIKKKARTIATQHAKERLTSADNEFPGWAWAKIVESLIKVDAKDEAHRVVARIEDPGERGGFLSMLASEWAREGELDRALAVLQELKDSDSQSDQLVGMVVNLASAERFDEARTLAKAIDSLPKKTEALAYIALFMAQSSEPRKASTLANQARRMEKKMSNLPDQVRVLCTIAFALWQAGDQSNAATVVNEALEAAKSITDDAQKVLGLSRVAQQLVIMNDQQMGRLLAEQALKCSESVNSDSQIALFLSELAKALVMSEVGGFAELYKLAKPIRENTLRNEMLAAVARALAEAAYMDVALLAVEMLESGDDFRKDTILEIVQGLDAEQIEEFDRLVDFVEKKTDGSDRAELLCDLAAAALEMGRPEQALTIWRAGFNGVESERREIIYTLLGKGAGTIGAVDRGESLWAIHNATIEIESWWSTK